MKLVRRSWSISSSILSSSAAASASRSPITRVIRDTMSWATWAIRNIVGRAVLGHREVGHPQPGDLGDVHRQVAHPLELADHPQRGDDRAQVAGDRLLERQDRERELLDPLGRPGRSGRRR